jgi:hypothetical protein
MSSSGIGQFLAHPWQGNRKQSIRFNVHRAACLSILPYLWDTS